MDIYDRELQVQLEAMAEDADRSNRWPSASWGLLRSAQVLGNSIPREYGGRQLAAVEFQSGMETIASCCMTTAFILSQREAAIRNLLRGPAALKQRYLPGLATGDLFLTVGLSQLTTSRQHLGPALRATALTEGGYQLDGEIPWVTGADQADAIVAGATLPDATQLLVVIPAEQLTGMIEPPLQLTALEGSRTSLIRCRGVRMKADDVLAGPTENVLGKSGGGGLDTSCLAVGLSAAAIQFIQHEAESRPDLVAIGKRFREALDQNRNQLHELAQTTNADPDRTLALRLECTKLALRSAQASLMIAKGIGFVRPHPVQRWTRQAMFFLVWSCPRPVAEGVLTDLAVW